MKHFGVSKEQRIEQQIQAPFVAPAARKTSRLRSPSLASDDAREITA